MPKHIRNLLLLLVIGGGLAIGAKSYFTDPSYYRFGDYRADAVPEIAAPEPHIQGSAYCQSCHPERQADWPNGAHHTVQCEVCHGVDAGHPDDGKSLKPQDVIRLCTTCHEAMPARPASQPQITLGQHPFPDEETPECTTCHDPHSPAEFKPEEGGQEAGTAESAVSAPASAARCAKCHGEHGEGVKRNPPLAGMDAKVFVERLELYKSGERSNKLMAKMAKSLSEEEAAELAEYYQSLAPKPAE